MSFAYVRRISFFFLVTHETFREIKTVLMGKFPNSHVRRTRLGLVLVCRILRTLGCACRGLRSPDRDSRDGSIPVPKVRWQASNDGQSNNQFLAISQDRMFAGPCNLAKGKPIYLCGNRRRNERGCRWRSVLLSAKREVRSETSCQGE